MPHRTLDIFSDFKTNFTPHPVTGDLVRITNLEAIKSSVKSLILTKHLERPFKPLVGSNVTHYLFENFTDVTEDNIRSAIIETIENYEPRAELLDVQVNSVPDNNRFVVTIVFRGVNNTKPTQLTVFLEQIR